MTYPAPDVTPNDPWFDDYWMPELGEEPPRPEEEVADNYQSRHESSPEFEKTAEETVTMHEKMYRMATAKYNPFAVGGSESIRDFQGGSENVR